MWWFIMGYFIGVLCGFAIGIFFAATHSSNWDKN